MIHSIKSNDLQSAGGFVLGSQNKAVSPLKSLRRFLLDETAACRSLAQDAPLSHVAKRATVRWTEIYRYHNLYNI